MVPVKTHEPAKEPSIQSQSDILVVGGGTAGAVAAIQAARAGARTLVIEMKGQLGGTMTAGGVDFPGLFHAWGRQVISGVGWELVCTAVELAGGTLPDFAVPYGQDHSRHHVRVNGPLYAAVAEQACLDAGVELCYYELPTTIEAVSEGWRVQSVGKGLQRTVTCKQLIDCTGGADIVGMRGYPRLREGTVQPGTYRFRLGGYDVEALDEALIEQHYEQALREGRLKRGDCKQIRFIHFLLKHGENAQYVFDADSSTSTTQTAANITGRQSFLRLLRFVRSLPGCENVKIAKMAQETGVRETYRIAGEVQVTHEDYVSGRVFDDAVCYSFYPIDVHTTEGVKPRHLPEGIVPTVPLRALVPRGSRNLLVAGRSISSDRLANSALRVQATCMAMGQVAGAAAALAARTSTTPLDVPLAELKALLSAHGAVVP